MYFRNEDGSRMNVIFCTSPFQVLVAKEVVGYVKEDFVGVYLKMSDDPHQQIYAERMQGFCSEVLILKGKTAFHDIKDYFDGELITNLYLASLDNPVALSIFNPSKMGLSTFDDGSTSVIPKNMYSVSLDRGIPYTRFTLSEVMSLSKRHYTVFEGCTLFPKDRQVILQLNIKPTNFRKAKNGKTLKVFLGQYLGSLQSREDLEITKKLTTKVLESKSIDYYYPHPRVPINFYNERLKETSLCFEEEIYNLLEEYEFVEVHGFYSTSLLLVKDIEGVSIQGYRTFLTTYESDVLVELGIPYQNLSLTDIPVDIVMPVYNGSKTISQSVESVLNQTHQNFKLLIVDYGSTDNTLEVCKPYLVDERIQYIRESHKGISETLNRGISLSETEYVARQDAGDVWMPWHLDLLLKELEKNPQLDLIGSRVVFKEEDVPEKVNLNSQNHLSGGDLWLALAYRNYFNHSTVIFKRSTYEEAGKYDPKCNGFEDWHLWSRMVTKDNAMLLDVITAYYRLSERYRRGMTFRARLARSRGLRLEDVMN